MVRRVPRQAGRGAGALLRRQPDRGHVVGEGHVAAGRIVPRRRPRRVRRRGARADGAGGDVRRDGLRQRRGARPARQRLPDRGPGARLPARGLPAGRADHPARDGRLADRARGVPVHLRGRPRAPPPRRATARPHRHRERRRHPARRTHRPDARHRHPQRAGRGRLRRRPTSTTWSPGRSSSSGCWPPPRARSPATTWRRCSGARWSTGEPRPGRGPAGRAAPGRCRRRLDQHPRPGAVLLRRLALPRGPAGGGPAAVGRRGRGRARGGPRGRGAADHARRGYVDRGQRGRTGHRGGHRQAPAAGARGRPGGAHRDRRAGRRPRRPAARGGPPRTAVRPRPLDAQPLHDRRDDRQQRLRLAGAGLRAHRRQRGRDAGAPGRRGPGFDTVAGRPARPAGDRAGRPRRRAPRARADALRPVRPAGQRLLPRAPAAGERPPPRPLPGRLGGHPRPGARGDRRAGARAGGHRAGGARLPRRWWRRRTRCRRCSPRPPG